MAINFATSCYHAYSDTPTGLAPDAWHFNPSSCTITPSRKKVLAASGDDRVVVVSMALDAQSDV